MHSHYEKPPGGVAVREWGDVGVGGGVAQHLDHARSVEEMWSRVFPKQDPQTRAPPAIRPAVALVTFSFSSSQ